MKIDYDLDAYLGAIRARAPRIETQVATLRVTSPGGEAFDVAVVVRHAEGGEPRGEAARARILTLVEGLKAEVLAEAPGVTVLVVPGPFRALPGVKSRSGFDGGLET